MEGKLLEGSNSVYTPDELEKLIEGGHLWSNLGNWQLRRPEEYLEELRVQADAFRNKVALACIKVNRFHAEMETWRKNQNVIVSKLGSPIWVKVRTAVLPRWTMCMLHPEDQHVYRAVCKAAPNARDYYVQPGDAFGQAVREHSARVSALNQIILDLTAIGENIYQQQEARKR